jgi:hypothetical protein
VGLSKEMLDISENESRLFRELGFGYLLDRINDPVALYKIVMEKLFIDNVRGPAVEAFRRGCRALYACKPYRQTPEFDKLLEF